MQGGVVVPAAEVHADLVSPPARQPGRPVEVDGRGLLQEGVPGAEHQGADRVASGVGHPLGGGDVPAARHAGLLPREHGGRRGTVPPVARRHPRRVRTVKVEQLHDDGGSMDARPARDRRRPRPGGGDGSWSLLRAALYRPLASDDDRAAYWVRHVRLGVVLTEISALAVIG